MAIWTFSDTQRYTFTMYKCLCILRDMCRLIHRHIHSQGHLNTQTYSHIHRHEHCDSQNSLGLTEATNYPYDAELWESSEIMLAIFWNVQCYIYKYKIIATYILCHIVWKCWGVSYKWISTQLKNITFNIYMNIYYIYNVFHTFCSQSIKPSQFYVFRDSLSLEFLGM